MESSTYHHNGATWHKNVVFHVTVQLHNKYMLTKITSISNNQIIESFVPLGISVSLDNIILDKIRITCTRIVNRDISKNIFFFFFWILIFLSFHLSKNFFIYMIYVLCNYLFNNYSKSFITINYSKIYFFFKNEPMSRRSIIVYFFLSD